MALKTLCPECDAPLRFADELAGQRVRCRACQTTFRVPDEPDDDEDARGGYVRDEDRRKRPARSYADEDERPRRRHEDDDEYEERRRPRRRRETSGGGGGTAILVIAAVLVGLLVVGGGVAGMAAWFLLRKAPAAGPPIVQQPWQPPAPQQPQQPAAPQQQWHTVQAAGRFTVQFPSPAQQSIEPGIAAVVMYKTDPTRDPFCGAGYSQQPLPAHRLQLPADQLLEDACNGGVASARQKGGMEVRRTPVMLGNYPGRELVINIPQAKGKLISRFYLAKGSIYIVMVGGAGIEPDSEITRKVFDSFKILE